MDPENTQTAQPITSIQSIPVQPITPVPQSKSKLPLILGVLVLFGVVGILVFFSKLPYLGNDSFNVNQPILSINPTPTPTADPTANWKTYSNSELSFKYPLNWREFSNNIVLDNSSIGLAILLKGEPIANECMEEVSVQEEKGVVVRKFKGVSTGGNCRATDSISRGIWIVPSVSTYSPALLYHYEDKDAAQAEIFLNLILSTFKFTDEKSLGEKIFCNSPRPEACTMECVAQPSYVCGSNGKFYCNKCVACSDSKIEWYIIKDEPCEN